ncbi:MAG: hypothetical protein ACI9EF_001473 [Pseudohongiellaceae bacterium]|jgi:hypothetical protein
MGRSFGVTFARAGFVAAALFFLSDKSAAQELDALVPVHLGSEFGFKNPDNPDQHVIVVVGGVELTQGPRRLLADTLVLVLANGDDDSLGIGPSIPSNRLVEVFLDGNVTIEEGDEMVVGAQSVLLDGPSGAITVIDGSWRTSLETESLLIRFDLMRQLQDGTRELEHLSYTTCDYAHAHWGIKTPWAVLTPTAEGRILKTSLNTGWVADVPLVVAPSFHFNIDRDRPPLRRIEFGNSRSLGTEIETYWAGDASEFLSNFAKTALGVDEPVEGKWKVELDNYSSRGVFLQPEWHWSTQSSFGRLLASAINDHNDEDYLPTPVSAGLGGRIEDNTRGRIELEHRTKIDDHRTLDVELSYLSDRGFLEEYYEGESRLDKPPETYVSYRDVRDNIAFTILAKGRANDFLDVIEYLPKVERREVGEPVSWLGGGFMTTRDFASWARHRDEGSVEGVASTVVLAPTHNRSDETVRIGTSRRVDWPIDIGPDRILLSAGVDLTAFDQRYKDDASTPAITETDGDAFLRHGLIGGARWSQTWSGSRPASSATWNIEGLRHVVEPSVSFNSVFELNRRPHFEGSLHGSGGDLIPIDDVETLDKKQQFVVGVRHRLQTHQGGQGVTILDTEVFMPIYPNERRDNPDSSHTNGNIVVLSQWNPGAHLWGLKTGRFFWMATLDPIKSVGVVKSRLSYRAAIGEGKSIQLSESRARRAAHFRTIGAEWLLTPKWSGAVFLKHDVLNHQISSQGLILRQLAHKWIIDIELSLRRGTDILTGRSRNEKRFKLSFRPTAFGDPDKTLLDELGRFRR